MGHANANLEIQYRILQNVHNFGMVAVCWLAMSQIQFTDRIMFYLQHCNCATMLVSFWQDS